MINLTQQIKDHFETNMRPFKLFRSSVTGRELWNLYLISFKDGDNNVFRDPQSSEFNCNHCNNFIRRYGNIVAINDNHEIVSLFDFKVEGVYETPMKALSKVLLNNKIESVFVETFNMLKTLPYESCKSTNETFRLGTANNVKKYTKEEAEVFGVVKENEIRTFNHFYLDIPRKFVTFSNDSVESIIGTHRDNKNVFQRAMEEIPLDILNLVKDLINQGSLLNGDTHLSKVETFSLLKTEYDCVPTNQKDNWCWLMSNNLPIARFRNELIGVLCSDLATGVELNKACQDWNKRVDPANYMKATAPITQRQINEAKKVVQEHGYEESFIRRVATIEDIKASEILHLNNDTKVMSIFDTVKATKGQRSKSKFDDVKEIGIDEFREKILPTSTSVELYLENRLAPNLFTMFTGEGKPIFKYPNNFSLTTSGNLAGKSELEEKVISGGGSIDGVFRFTHSWNKINPNRSLMDLHVFMPGCVVPSIGGGPNVKGQRVGWNKRKDLLSGGTQDVDYTPAAPIGHVPVENITFPRLDKMPEGKYTCKIHNWDFRKSGGEGEAQIAFGNEIYDYIYPKTTHHQWITIAEVTLKDGKFSIKHFIDPINVPKELYGLNSNEFHKVNLLCLSPNHWGPNKVGDKQYLFSLDGCRADRKLRTFHNVDLNNDLKPIRKVLETLGQTTMIQPEGKQLSGVCFNATVRDSVIVKVKGSHQRLLKIKF